MPPLRKPSTRAVDEPDHPLFDGMDLCQKTEIRNVKVYGQRTSMRLEPAFWDTLIEIAQIEGRSLGNVLEMLELKRGDGSLTASARIFAIAYQVAKASQVLSCIDKMSRP